MTITPADPAEVITPVVSGTPDDGGQGKASEAPKNDEFKAITTQAEFDGAIRNRLAREAKKYEGYEDFKAKAAKYEELEAQQGSDIEKLTRRAEKAERERDEFKAKVSKSERLEMVRDIADELGLPKKLVSRVQGDDEEAIRADIADLLDGLPAPSTDAGPDEQDASNKGRPPTRTPKTKMKFSATGDEASAQELSAEEIMKDIPRGGLR